MTRSPGLVVRWCRTYASKAERFVQPISPETLPRGYLVASTYAGVKKAISPGTSSVPMSKPDMALVVSSVPASVAGVFTTNAFRAAPVVHATTALQQAGPDARVRAVLTNSGCANAVTGEAGLDDTRALVEQVRASLAPSSECTPTDVLMMSTGVIGVRLPVLPMRRAIEDLVSGRLLQNHPEAWLDVARAFMTTDTFPKLRTRSFSLGGRQCRIAGIDKGAGMIHPRMASASSALHATMLGLFATDAPIATPDLQRCLNEAVRVSFNCVSVDGDMSTNDTVVALANGQATAEDGSVPDEWWTEKSHPDLVRAFQAELTALCTEMAQLLVRDGEGAEKFVQVRVRHAGTYEQAHAIAASISTSALVKCAMHGEDANWGRILCAAGYAALPAPAWAVDPSKVHVTFEPPPGVQEAPLPTLIDGVPQVVDEAHAARLLRHEDIYVDVDLQGGTWRREEAVAEAVYWTCDFSKEYITINGDYRT